VPPYPAPLGPRPQSLSAAADLLLAKHCEFVAYALKADPLLRLSAKMGDFGNSSGLAAPLRCRSFPLRSEAPNSAA
jgi:hypothetical protein